MIFVSVVLLTSSLLGLDTNFSVTSSKPKIAIVDMGGGGGGIQEEQKSLPVPV